MSHLSSHNDSYKNISPYVENSLVLPISNLVINPDEAQQENSASYALRYPYIYPIFRSFPKKNRYYYELIVHLYSFYILSKEINVIILKFCMTLKPLNHALHIPNLLLQILFQWKVGKIPIY